MTEKQLKFVELERKKEDVRKYFDELKLAVIAVAAECGIGGSFQDEQGVVYKVVEPEGKFITYDRISYIRTRRPHEKRGDLSMKEAESLGFRLPTRD